MNDSFGKYVKKLRGDKTKTEIARKTNFTPEYIRKIEEENKIPSQEILIQLAEALGVDKKEFLFKALQSKAPKKAKKFFDIHPLYYTIPIKSPSSISGSFSSFNENKHILDSLVFEIPKGILEPLVKDAQKLIISYSAPIKCNDYVICNIDCHEEDYTNRISKFKRNTSQFKGITVKSGPDYFWGKVIKYTKKSLQIKNIENKQIIEFKNSEITDIKIVRIMGILF